MIANEKMHWRFNPSFTEVLCLCAGSFLVIWHAWLMDDAYIYFRYADNLTVHGRGLVWNPGEYVEGFSSPLWMLLLCVLRLCRVNYWTGVLTVGLASFFLFWWLACLVNRAFVGDAANRRVASFNIPLVYVTFNYGALCYFTSGLEAPLVNVMSALYAAAAVWPQAVVLQAAVGISPLVRHELAVPFFLFLAYCVFFKSIKPYCSLLTCVVFAGGYGLFRVWYYADLFPNTFYLKDAVMIPQGLAYVYDTVAPYYTIPYCAVMTAACILLSRRPGETADTLKLRERLALLIFSAPVVLYVIKIGGDPRHFRYLAFPFILTALAGGGIFEKLACSFPENSRRLTYALVVVFAIVMFATYPKQLNQHPAFRDHLDYVHTQRSGINDAAAHRLHEDSLSPPPFSSASWLSWSAAKKRCQPGGDGSREPGSQNHRKLRLVTVSSKTGGGVAVDHWCKAAYLQPSIPVIHSLGLTEPFLARTKMRSDRPAHKYGLQKLAVDILKVRTTYGFMPDALSQAFRDSPAATPSWICNNMASIRMIERKAYNSHDLSENIGLAITPVRRIVP